MARTVPEILEHTSRHYGARVAMELGEEALTYGELDALSNRIAHVLANYGAVHGDRIALCLDKSCLAVAYLYGVMKAGCVCVPTDPNGPPARLAHILADSGARFLVAGSGKMSRLREIVRSAPSLEGMLVADGPGHALDDPASYERDAGAFSVISESMIALAPSGSVQYELADTDLAAILYTSGSTGRPRGVMISHANIGHFAGYASNYFKLTPEDRVSCHAPLHFDLTLFDIHATFHAGATACLIPQGISFMARDLLAYITARRVTVWQSVPSVLRLLNRQMKGGELDAIRLVIFAGEPYPLNELRDLMAKAPDAVFYNIYGSTEINDVTFYHVQTPFKGEALPIGKAWCGADVFAIDEDGKKIERPGVIGELFVRGPTVSPGYWRDRAQTKTRFVQNPLHDDFPDRVFRTGDMVELDFEENFLFAGRRDFLVKIRGNRVNPGEVEQALLAHPEIAAAAVIDRKNEADEVYLKAFFVSERESEIDPRMLRRHCLAHVPAYMVPESFVRRESLPRTSTGKIDRQALRQEGGSPATGQPASARPAPAIR